MRHEMELDALPAEVTFPAHLQDRISYDHARRRLMFVGFMSKNEFDQLHVLSRDFAYQRAIENLFCASGQAAEQNSRGLSGRFVLVCLVVAVAVVAAAVYLAFG